MCEVQGLPAKTLISEYAPGQMEIVLRHRADVLKACDEAIMLKRLIKNVAEKHGLAATFMAKPYSAWTGSGMHIHVSLADEHGQQPVRGGGARAEQAADACDRRPQGGDGGVDADLRAQRQFLPPLPAQFLCAGLGLVGHQQPHREPAHSGGPAPKACHIEHRPSGADANPYLVMAAIIAGMHDGILRNATRATR